MTAESPIAGALRRLRAVAERVQKLDPASPYFELELAAVKEGANLALIDSRFSRGQTHNLEYARAVRAEKMKKRAAARHEYVLPAIRKLRAEGSSYAEIADALAVAGFKPPQSEKWHASTVRHILKTNEGAKNA